MTRMAESVKHQSGLDFESRSLSCHLGPAEVTSSLSRPITPRRSCLVGDNALDLNAMIADTRLVEQWLSAHGYKNITSAEVPPWRRQHMSNLVAAFDFDHPDYSLPSVASSSAPLRDFSMGDPKDGQLGALSGNYIGAAVCESTYSEQQPPVPYGPDNANAVVSNLTEQGFKRVRGALTEGRYLTFEYDGMALTNSKGFLSASKATTQHDDIKQRWVLHQQGPADSNIFKISSAEDGTYIAASLALTKDVGNAQTFTLTFLGNGKGYSVGLGAGSAIGMVQQGQAKLVSSSQAAGFQIFSVTYRS